MRQMIGRRSGKTVGVRMSTMENLFPGYYQPSDADFKRLWDEAWFIPDANVLLNLYRYTPDTSHKLLEIFQRVGDRLWVPHQAAWEYQEHRLEEIGRQRGAYKRVIEALESARSRLAKDLEAYARHPF